MAYAERTLTSERLGPPVTAVIATRNRPDLLERAVLSVLDQDYEGPLECVVVFDQSEPHRLTVPDRQDRKLRVIENRRTPGLAGARNSGALEGTGEFIAFCDDDDEWLPSKLSTQIAQLRLTPDADVI